VTPPFEVAVTSPVTEAALAPGAAVKIHAKFERRAGFVAAFTLNALGLPDGVTAAAVAVPAGTNEVDLEIKAMPTVRPGVYSIVLDAVTANSAQVMLDRVSKPILLKIGPAKTALRTGTTRSELGVILF